ncbi:MAG: heavy metal-responsive transcriptional regulator [Marinosulfonomonas sp.]|nr:MAG: heavy metal-responsive transcriptional regulator [Marinosulfonomonas sp.]
MESLTISGAASKAGVGVETLRFYERKGLISQPLKPRNGGYRQYSQELIDRVQFVRQAQDLGFSLKEVRELLDLRADPDSDCNDVKRRASVKLLEIESKIKGLRKIGDELHVLIASCPSKGSLEDCSIIANLDCQPTSGDNGPC